MVVVLVTGCSTTTKVNYDRNPDFDFSTLKSYYILTQSEKPDKYTTLQEKRTANAISTRLNQSGFKQADKESADFLVAFQHDVEKKTRMANGFLDYGHAPYWGGFYVQPAYIREYKKGTLIIDIIDPNKKEVVWRGSVSAKLLKNLPTAEKKTQLTLAVDRILSGFPN